MIGRNRRHVPAHRRKTEPPKATLTAFMSGGPFDWADVPKLGDLGWQPWLVASQYRRASQTVKQAVDADEEVPLPEALAIAREQSGRNVSAVLALEFYARARADALKSGLILVDQDPEEIHHEAASA